MNLPQSKPSPHSSLSCSTRSRNAPARPGVKPPPVPAGKDELARPQLQPVTTTQRQTSSQVNTLPPVKSEKKQKQAPPPLSGFLASLVPKNNSQPSAVPKPRPDPPTRPPPPCPVNKTLLVTHFYLFIYLFLLSFKKHTYKVSGELGKMSILWSFSNIGKAANKRPPGSC